MPTIRHRCPCRSLLLLFPSPRPATQHRRTQPEPQPTVISGRMNRLIQQIVTKSTVECRQIRDGQVKSFFDLSQVKSSHFWLDLTWLEQFLGCKRLDLTCDWDLGTKSFSSQKITSRGELFAATMLNFRWKKRENRAKTIGAVLINDERQ